MKSETLRVLLIEDNDDHAELVTRSFEHNKIENKLDRVVDGEQALNYLFKKEDFENNKELKLPHLIILDLRLPKIDGFKVLKEIKSHSETKKIPVVILTSSDSPKDIEKSYSNHANSYLVKPIEYKLLSKLIKDVSNYWLNWNKQPTIN